MEFGMVGFYSPLVQKQAIEEVERCNEFTAELGLTLSYAEVQQLVATRTLALKNNGRVEFGGGVISKLIESFSTSPYIASYNYASTINELIEMFYFYKNETLELLGDDELIEFMKESFDGVCEGSLELLAGRELAEMSRTLRYHYTSDDLDRDNSEEEGEDEYGEC